MKMQYFTIKLQVFTIKKNDSTSIFELFLFIFEVLKNEQIASDNIEIKV